MIFCYTKCKHNFCIMTHKRFCDICASGITFKLLKLTNTSNDKIQASNDKSQFKIACSHLLSRCVLSIGDTSFSISNNKRQTKHEKLCLYSFTSNPIIFFKQDIVNNSNYKHNSIMASSAEKRYVHFYETSYSYKTVCVHLFFIIKK